MNADALADAILAASDARAASISELEGHVRTPGRDREIAVRMAEAALPHLTPPLLDEDTITALLRECVTVVRPGEVLVILAREEWGAAQVNELQVSLDEIVKFKGWEFEVLIVPGVASRAEVSGA